MLVKSKLQTQRLAARLAEKILRATPYGLRVTVIALQGDLGSGKTTFTQGFCKALGVKHGVASPTFIIMRKHPISKRLTLTAKRFLNIYHFDLYRLKKPKEVLDLGFRKIINPPAGGPQNIVLIEWPEVVKKLLPKNAIWIKFEHGKKANERFIRIKN